jgi:hypothetical protein
MSVELYVISGRVRQNDRHNNRSNADIPAKSDSTTASINRNKAGIPSRTDTKTAAICRNNADIPARTKYNVVLSETTQIHFILHHFLCEKETGEATLHLGL